MQAALKIVDQSTSGEALAEFRLELVSDKVTVREVIERRVRHEVEAFNAQSEQSFFRGLVEPTGAERVLNGVRLKKNRRLDPDEQVAAALKGFETNGFFMLAEGRQMESLDEELFVTGEGLITFVKLVPLVGG